MITERVRSVSALTVSYAASHSFFYCKIMMEKYIHGNQIQQWCTNKQTNKQAGWNRQNWGIEHVHGINMVSIKQLELYSIGSADVLICKLHNLPEVNLCGHYSKANSHALEKKKEEWKREWREN